MLTRWGFTTVFDTGSPLKNTLALRKRIETGAVDGPTFFTTGEILLPPGVRGSRFRLQTPDDAVPLVAGGQARGLDRIDMFVRAEMARQKVPGVAIAIVKKGSVFAAKGYGFANVEHHIPVGPETIFQSGSDWKTVHLHRGNAVG